MNEPNPTEEAALVNSPVRELHSQLDMNIEAVQQAFGHSSDIIIQKYGWNSNQNQAAVMYTEGLIDPRIVMEHIIEPLKKEGNRTLPSEDDHSSTNGLEHVKGLLTSGAIKETTDLERVFEFLLSGNTVVLLDGYSTALVSSTKGGDERSVSEPSTQTVIRGPRDSFVESISTNIALIRRKINNVDLWLETMHIGKMTKTKVGMMYIKGVAEEEIVSEIRSRLSKINIDSILESGYIEELIQDKTFTPFPTLQNTDRPDGAAAALLEGRIAILVDGTPFVLLAPALFIQFFQASEDYYQRWDIASLIRILRYISFGISMLAPSVYIAVTTFHQELVPTPLITNLAAQREGVPFPAFVEALLMEVMFEVLREAGTRMGRAIGTSISIVGTLVIGQAAVEAGMVSAAMVIVVSSTAISNFVSPTFNMGISARMLRFILMLLSATLGLYGVTLGIIVIVLHLCSLRSFGVPYMSPIAPFSTNDQEDVLIRLPRWMMRLRPKSLNPSNPIREGTNKLKKGNTP